MKDLNKRIILIVVLLISIITFAQNDAKKILDEVSTKIKSYETLYIEFSNTLDNKEADVHEVTKGSASLKGDLYIVKMLGITTVFDGKKVYSMDPETEEVNISDSDEDVFTPAQFFSFYEEGYNYELDKTEIKNGRKLQYVKLTPIDSNSEFKYVTLAIDVKTKHIKQMIQTGENGVITTLTITKFKFNLPLSDKLFAFNKNKYEDKGYIINEF